MKCIKNNNRLIIERRNIIMKIMFICTGNICRSAMAEGIMRKMLEDEKIKNVDVCSCGIYAETRRLCNI